jgi:hypothetical protein
MPDSETALLGVAREDRRARQPVGRFLTEYLADTAIAH